ncbi:MAG: hypothetical protein NZO16_07445, partial [Deltaproteobacteria bacterium]|nr:hypothetical protein [Deltaproteobacteria bacterium]
QQQVEKLLEEHPSITRLQVVQCLLKIFDKFIKTSLTIVVHPSAILLWHKSPQNLNMEDALLESIREDQSLINACKVLQLAIAVADIEGITHLATFISERNSLNWSDFYGLALMVNFAEDPCPTDPKILRRRLNAENEGSREPNSLLAGYRQMLDLLKQGDAKQNSESTEVTRKLFAAKAKQIFEHPFYKGRINTALCMLEVVEPLIILGHKRSTEVAPPNGFISGEYENSNVSLLLEELCQYYSKEARFLPKTFHFIPPCWFYRKLVEWDRIRACYLIIQTEDMPGKLFLLSETLKMFPTTRDQQDQKFELLRLEVENQVPQLLGIEPQSPTNLDEAILLIYQFATFLEVIGLCMDKKIDIPLDKAYAAIERFHQAIQSHSLSRPDQTKRVFNPKIPRFVAKSKILEPVWHTSVEFNNLLWNLAKQNTGLQSIISESTKKIRRSFHKLASRGL